MKTISGFAWGTEIWEVAIGQMGLVHSEDLINSNAIL